VPARVTLTIQGGALDGTEYEFEGPGRCTVGRSEECSMRLPKRGWEFQMVSRRHCQIDIETARVHVRDLGSRNGTYVNGRLIGLRESDEAPAAAGMAYTGSYELRDGDVLSVGPVNFGVKVTPMGTAAAATCEAIPETRKGPEDAADWLMVSI